MVMTNSKFYPSLSFLFLGAPQKKYNFKIGFCLHTRLLNVLPQLPDWAGARADQAAMYGYTPGPWEEGIIVYQEEEEEEAADDGRTKDGRKEGEEIF